MRLSAAAGAGWKYPASCRRDQRPRGGGGTASEDGGGHEHDEQGERGDGMRDAVRGGSRGNTHLVVSSLFAFV